MPDVQIGPNLHSFIAIQATQHHQSIGKIQCMLKDLFQLNFSTGAISAAQGRVTEYLADTDTQIHETVKASKLIMADETSHQRNNDKRWMWAALSNDVTFFQINSGRNQHAARRLLGEAVSHLLVTDQYYRRLRRLRKSWLHWLKLGSYQCSERYRGRCRNLIADDAMVWRFMDDSEYPLTNNAAERVLRNYILMRKCCYVTRSYRGDQFRERMFSLIETVRLQQLSAYKWLREIVEHHMLKVDYQAPLFLA
ncbi:transposase [Vibrio metschnikovii]|uniref:IS66 family transposase n=1 Tax=Vibrio metschnikovii TaxID=28172 RepID=UPI00315D4001